MTEKPMEPANLPGNQSLTVSAPSALILGEYNTLEPMSADQFNRGIALLILHAGAMNIDCDDRAIQALYRSVLGHLPGELFIRSVRRVLANWTDTFRLPLPGHVMEDAKSEMDRRHEIHRAEHHARIAARPIDIGPRIPDDELDALMAGTRQQLAKSSAGR